VPPTGTAVPATDTPGPSPTACSITFTDVPPGSTFYPYIHCLACLGIVNGYPDGTFRPFSFVTRGQLSKIASNAAGFNDNQTTLMFEDVPAGSTFFQFIGRLASRGYVSGYACGGPGEPCGPGNMPYFRPYINVTRGQMAKILSNSAGFNEPPSGQQFQDIPPGSVWYPYAYRLDLHNVIHGYPCGGNGEPCLPPNNLPYYRPNADSTRAQVAQIVSLGFFPNCTTP
jgi:hypothetical protein